jgi:hypothetical protein
MRLRRETNRIAIIESKEEVRSTPEVEHPDQEKSQPGPQPSQRNQGQNRGHEIAVCSRAGECDCQFWRNNAWHQECQPDEPEAVQDEQWT